MQNEVHFLNREEIYAISSKKADILSATKQIPFKSFQAQKYNLVGSKCTLGALSF